MLKEIEKAVEMFHSIAFGTKVNAAKVPENKLVVFIKVLTDLLTARYKKNWYPENPERGSGYRCIRVNTQSIDPTVVESLKRADIDIVKGLIITEVTIWVDPGVVSVRIGEDGSIGPIVVDEEVYNMRRKTKSSQKDTDEGFSSRSSSPQSSMSDSSRTASPCMSTSPVPTKYITIPSSSAIEYNPYSPPVHISYPSLHQHTPATLSAQQPMRNLSPKASYLQPQVLRPHGQSVTPFASSVMSSANSDVFSHIPASTAQLAAVYTQPRSLFATQDSSSTSAGLHDTIGKIAFNPYHQSMSMIYGSNLAQTNFYDIPAMA